MLYSLYIDECYSRYDAVKNIFTKNLTGIDLDTRAKQLATFALLLKAAQIDPKFLDGDIMPRIYDMPNVDRYTWRDLNGHMTCALQIEGASEDTYKELDECFTLMEQAQNLGSIMKFDISKVTRDFIIKCVEEQKKQHKFEESFRDLFRGFDIILALTEKYAALAMNPPYMGSGNMNSLLSDYVKKNYEEGKADLFSVFMLVAIDRLSDKGKYGMINMHSWMFISSFEKLRHKILDTYHIDSLLHLGPRTFDELSGEVVQNSSFVITRFNIQFTGTYYRLIDGYNCGDKERMFINASSLEKIYYPNINQLSFEKIPGCPIGYWVSDRTLKNFVDLQPLANYALGRVGLITGDSGRFIKNWNEVNFKKIGFNIKSNNESILSGKKWFPIHNGGTLRKWYGNLTSVVNWQNDGDEMKNDNYLGTRCKSHNYNGDLAFKESFSWNTISTEKFTCRYAPIGFMFDTAGPFGQIIDTESMNVFSVMGFLNSIISNKYLNLINPTINFPPGCVLSMPINIMIANENIIQRVKKAIEISKKDWDAHETSWDFEENEIVGYINEARDIPLECTFKDKDGKLGSYSSDARPSFYLESLYDEFKTKWTEKFVELHTNEEELNRQFIEIYGLEDELTPEVPLDEITILQQGEISIENNDIVWHSDVVMKHFISYAIGCMMGRYRLDKKGLCIAHPNPTAEEIAPYEYHGFTFEIDDDGIIPLMSKDSRFDDNGVNRLTDFIKMVVGELTLTENMNFLEEALGKSVEQYLVKDFWKDH